MDLESKFLSTNSILILFATGLIVWMIRQVIPDHVEQSKIWRLLVRVMPPLIGAGLSFIPGLVPMDKVSQSLIVGAICGALSSNVYEVSKEALGQRIKSMLSSPQYRKKQQTTDDGDSVIQDPFEEEIE